MLLAAVLDDKWQKGPWEWPPDAPSILELLLGRQGLRRREVLGPGQAGRAACLSGGEAEGQRAAALGGLCPGNKAGAALSLIPSLRRAQILPKENGWARIYQAGSETLPSDAQRETGTEPPQVADLRLLEGEFKGLCHSPPE